MKILLISSVGILLLAIQARGQSRTDQALIQKLTPIIKQIPQFNSSWKIMVLDESQWKKFKAIASNNSGKGDIASTSLEEHITVLRESFVKSADDQFLKHVLWHEAGHINCKCSAEEIAEQFARQHMN